MSSTNVLTETECEPDQPPARFTGRRLVRWIAILALGIVVVLAIWQEPLYAGRL